MPPTITLKPKPLINESWNLGDFLVLRGELFIIAANGDGRRVVVCLQDGMTWGGSHETLADLQSEIVTDENFERHIPPSRITITET